MTIPINWGDEYFLIQRRPSDEWRAAHRKWDDLCAYPDRESAEANYRKLCEVWPKTPFRILRVSLINEVNGSIDEAR